MCCHWAVWSRSRDLARATLWGGGCGGVMERVREGRREEGRVELIAVHPLPLLSSPACSFPCRTACSESIAGWTPRSPSQIAQSPQHLIINIVTFFCSRFLFLGLKGTIIYAQINTAVCPFAVLFFIVFNMQHTHKGPFLCTLSWWVGGGGMFMCCMWFSSQVLSVSTETAASRALHGQTSVSMFTLYSSYDPAQTIWMRRRRRRHKLWSFSLDSRFLSQWEHARKL